MGIEGSFSIADVRDLADGVIAACHKGRRGESYILTGETITMHDMFREISNAAGLSVKSYILSKEFAQMAVNGLAAVSRVMGKDPLLSEFNIYMLSRNNEYDCSKAERELGFHCRPFSESIRDTVIWLREDGFLDAAEQPKVMPFPLFGTKVPGHN
jgi:dihydroflavonol-4-reductase